MLDVAIGGGGPALLDVAIAGGHPPNLLVVIGAATGNIPTGWIPTGNGALKGTGASFPAALDCATMVLREGRAEDTILSLQPNTVRIGSTLDMLTYLTEVKALDASNHSEPDCY